MTPEDRRTLDAVWAVFVNRPKDDDYSLFAPWGGFTLFAQGVPEDDPDDPGQLKKAA